MRYAVDAVHSSRNFDILKESSKFVGGTLLRNRFRLLSESRCPKWSGLSELIHDTNPWVRNGLASPWIGVAAPV